MANPDSIRGQGFHTHPERINRKGRPPKKNLSDILKAMLEEKIEVKMEDGTKEKKEFREVLVRNLIQKASKGDIRAIQEIFDRVEGKSKQAIELDSNTFVRTIQIVDASENKSEV